MDNAEPLPVDPLTSLQPLLDLAGVPQYVAADDLASMGGETEVFRLGAEEGDSAAGVCPPDTGSRERCESLGDYPLLDTKAALERLTTLLGGPTPPLTTTTPPVTARPAPAPPETAPPTTACILMLPDDGSGTVCDERPDSDSPTTTMVAPGPPATDPPITVEPPGGPTTTAPAPEPPPSTSPPTAAPPTTAVPQPTEVEVTGVELIYMEVASLDDSGTYLVPIYRFTDGEGGELLVIAITDEMLTPSE